MSIRVSQESSASNDDGRWQAAAATCRVHRSQWPSLISRATSGDGCCVAPKTNAEIENARKKKQITIGHESILKEVVYYEKCMQISEKQLPDNVIDNKTGVLKYNATNSTRVTS